jgi:hypothetical protein
VAHAMMGVEMLVVAPVEVLVEITRSDIAGDCCHRPAFMATPPVATPPVSAARPEAECAIIQE